MKGSNLKANLLDLKSKLALLEKDIGTITSPSVNKNDFNAKKKSQSTEEKINELLAQKGKFVNLNIGGKVFTTTVSTLENFKISKLYKTYIEDPSLKEYFFDRSYKYFPFILAYLREKEFNLKKFKKWEKEDIRAEIAFYELEDAIQIPKKMEYDIGWDMNKSKQGACSLSVDDPKVLKIHSNTCYTYFVTDKSWKTENFVIELESNVQQNDSYLYYGIVNETFSFGNCMCCSPQNAFYLMCDGNFKMNGVTTFNGSFAFRSEKAIIGIRVILEDNQKQAYFYIPDRAEHGPFTLTGETFTIVAGHCNTGNGEIKILSCTDA